MIIVSQDKETIINFENITRISIIPPQEEGYKYSIAINNCLDLGYYKTEERAKEILKEMVRKYELGTNKIKIKNSRGAEIVERKIIYEMPKE